MLIFKLNNLPFKKIDVPNSFKIKKFSLLLSIIQFINGDLQKMPTRYADATWEGGLKTGKGNVKLESGLFDGPYDYLSRFEEGPQSNPEELLGASHAGCFAMFLGSLLEKNETPATKLDVRSSVTVKPTDDGPTITSIVLKLVGQVPNISEDKFLELAKQAKEKCPISKSLAAVAEMTLDASLKS